MVKSLTNMIEQLEGLLGTKDISEWETKFIQTVAEKKKNTPELSTNQVSKVIEIHERHFS